MKIRKAGLKRIKGKDGREAGDQWKEKEELEGKKKRRDRKESRRSMKGKEICI